MNYFTRGMTPAEIKARYRELAMEWHPDRPQNRERQAEATAKMQAINAAYHAALKNADGFTEKGTDGEQHTYRYNEANEAAATEIIDKLLQLKMENVDIALIGAWVWVIGETKQYKEMLGKDGLKLSWHSKRVAWYWKPTEWQSRYNSKASLEDLAKYYGVKHFANGRTAQQAAANLRAS